jgi:phenylacetate-coenzyme A ligase PaaK-like adenylate-forming protein
MAKRRDLKKAIEYLSGELMIETLLCSLQPKTDKEKLREMMNHIIDMNDEYRRRIRNPSGTAGGRLIKQYYRKLSEDLNAEVDRIYGELILLNKERIKN